MTLTLKFEKYFKLKKEEKVIQLGLYDWVLTLYSF